MEIKLRYVIGIKKRGGRKGDRTLYYWYRKGFSLRRLPDKFGTPEMVALVNHLNDEADAERIVAETKTPGTFGWLVDNYLDSPEAEVRQNPEDEGLSPRTFKNYEYWLRRLEKKFGDLLIAGIDREFVRDLRNSMRKIPSAGNICIEVLRMVLGWAVDNGKLPKNPALKPGRLKMKHRRAVWDDDAEKCFLEHAGEAMRLAYFLGVNTAQRLGDICAMTWGQYDGETIRLLQQKTGEQVEVPCPAILKAELDRVKRRGITMLVTPTGRSFKPSNFNLQWKKVIRAADIEGLQFRDLRRTAMVRLAEAGATPIQISAISGHSIDRTERILEVYIPRNREMAKAAVVALDEHRKKTKV
jgi:integrase